jgi:hypothetical protein
VRTTGRYLWSVRRPPRLREFFPPLKTPRPYQGRSVRGPPHRLAPRRPSNLCDTPHQGVGNRAR